jgi:hypothetical protein
MGQKPNIPVAATIAGPYRAEEFALEYFGDLYYIRSS